MGLFGKTTLCSLFAVAALVTTKPARAACPEGPVSDDAECDPYVAGFVPSIGGVAYFPKNSELGPMLGVGAELLLLTWSNSSESFGPAQGKIRVGFSELWSTKTSSEKMILYRGGVVVSFEKNPKRNFLIPFFAGDFGGVHASDIGGHAFADAGLGFYILYLRGFMLDAEGSYLFPFSRVDDLAGPKAHLTASVAFW